MTIASLRKLLRYNPLTYIFLTILGLVAVYSSWYANYYLSGNSDDILYPYLFKHFKFHDILLPGQHSNILKFPLFILQSIIPYNFRTFTIVNIGLVLIMIIGWALLLIWLFGKRYTVLICLGLITILVGSQLFNLDVVGTTIRNIEYPIVLSFIVSTAGLINRQKQTRNKHILGVVVGLLYSMTIAGDSFFFYTVFLSILAALAILWFNIGQSKKQQLRFGYATGYVLIFSILALIIREAVKFLGIAHYYTAAVFSPHILPLNHLGPSVAIASTQLLNLFDANIFGQNVSISNSLVFVNFALMIVGIIGLFFIFKDSFTERGRKRLLIQTDISRVFVLGAVSLATLVIFVLYILSDLVVVQSPLGVISSAGQDRYITIIPLSIVVGLVYIVWRKFDKRSLIYLGLPIVIALALIVNTSSITSSHTYSDAARNSEIAVDKVAKSNHVSLLLTGYWYGATTEFWSKGSLQFASISDCNIPSPSFNTRISWYKPSSSVSISALVVVHQGPDSIYWDCSNQQLINIYGHPEKIIKIDANADPELWVYNYDVRTKLTPISY